MSFEYSSAFLRYVSFPQNISLEEGLSVIGKLKKKKDFKFIGTQWFCGGISLITFIFCYIFICVYIVSLSWINQMLTHKLFHFTDIFQFVQPTSISYIFFLYTCSYISFVVFKLLYLLPDQICIICLYPPSPLNLQKF